MKRPVQPAERDPRAADRGTEAALLRELEEVYRDADAAYDGWSCDASTDCCHFGRTGREPYVTSIEVAAIRRASAARGRPRIGGRVRLELAERRCPLLDAAGRCDVYGARPIGCRTFYCDRAAPNGAVKHREVLALVARVQAIAVRHEPEGDRGRPLTRALADSSAGRSRSR